MFKKMASDPNKPPQERRRYAEMLKLAEPHEFWDSQPVQKFLSRIEKDGVI